jgi:hypothetical protein
MDWVWASSGVAVPAWPKVVMWSRKMADRTNTWAWVLTAVMAFQPALVPCTCGVSCENPAKTPVQRRCCCKTTETRVPVGSPTTMAGCSQTARRPCRCNGAYSSVCNCKTPSPESRQPALPQRTESTDLAAFAISISHGPLLDAAHGSAPAGTADLLPACVSASERCALLCRMLI